MIFELRKFAVAVAVVTLGCIVAFKYTDWVLIPAARSGIASKMTVPDSLQFRAENISAEGWLCGEVNERNGYGAYAGFKKFISNKQKNVHFIEGSGRLGELSNDDLAEILQEKAEILKSYLSVRKSVSNAVMPSEHEINVITVDSLFKKRWAQLCS